MNKIPYRYSLDRSSRKFQCPHCGQKRFVRYKDEAGEYLPENVGRCDRETSCTYHYTPKEFFYDNPRMKSYNVAVSLAPENEQINRSVDYLPFELMDRSVTNHKHCDLFPFLEKIFGEETASDLCLNYFIGTTSKGSTAFWQVDVDANVRQVKVIHYDSATGRRNKKTGAYFAGKKILKNNNANFQQTFFGEYLLTMPQNKTKPIALVESEKSAVIASVYYPQCVWLATGGKHGCKWTDTTVCRVLSGKKVILFPDLGAYDSWKSKGLLMASVACCKKIIVSDLLEANASFEEKLKGLDIADFILQEGHNLQ
jgi:DNA-directed RNA polymerase subunit RPC12/RpoP